MTDTDGRDAPEQTDDERSPESSRRGFLSGSLMGAVALGSLGAASLARAQVTPPSRSTLNHHYVPANASTVHWGYFSKQLKPVIEIESGDFVTLETVTHHAYDDYERMIKGDP